MVLAVVNGLIAFCWPMDWAVGLQDGNDALTLGRSGSCTAVLRNAERLQRWLRRRYLTLWACAHAFSGALE